MVAILWMAPGVALERDRDVGNPPPPVIYVVVRVPRNVMSEQLRPGDLVPTHTAVFLLKDWSPSGEVAHYELANRPPDGYRWLASSDRIVVEGVT